MRLSCLLENRSPVTGDHLTYALKALMVAVASGGADSAAFTDRRSAQARYNPVTREMTA
jgi:hypothetical protein